MKECNKEIFVQKLDELFSMTTKSSSIHECSMYVENSDGSFSWNKGYGGRTLDSVMNLASITKLFTTTCVINLVQQGKLSMDDNLSKFFGPEILEGIHIYHGKDYSYKITVENLLFQNTGFPDVFAMDHNRLNKPANKKSRLN